MSDEVTTHVHRPLEQYFYALVNVGFGIDRIREPMPTVDIESKYPAKWRYPRFLGMRCVKT
ncbi:unnamed protein product [marine sediment metagenome]|uniref:Uncharacterized protein n=1 Tax=marine sediment metagenome TaxID=412755 RepID=X1EHW2_9ZZZZ